MGKADEFAALERNPTREARLLTSTRRIDDAAKRLLDVALATSALVVLSPVLLATAVAIALSDGRPVFFRQRRPGLRGQPFTILKFRTMRSTIDGEVASRTDSIRVTRLGRFLRATSLDELPELWNVLRGEMSLVGPRPLLMEYMHRYTPRQQGRHDVRPGMTGWAIVQGRHSLRFEERLELDVWYVEHRSLRLDLRILWLTLGQVFRRTDTAVVQDVDAVGFPLEDPVSGSPDRP